jgi:cyclic beta-1,2-glucan synthetase
VTPAPWVNVLANPHFGTVISESGVAYTWSENAHEFRLTPWHNDPVSDTGGEALYLRDEETGHFWSPTPCPPAATPYVIRHGFGYSVFETRGGICSELTVYVAIDAAVKFSVLKVRNESGRPRKLSATGYVEWVLGDLRAKTAMHVSTEVDPAAARSTRATLQPEFADGWPSSTSTTADAHGDGDRTEFIGRNGTLRAPGRHAAHRVCPARWAPASTPAGRSRSLSNWPTGRSAKSSSASASGATPTKPGGWCSAFAASMPARDALEAVRSSGSTRSVRCRWKHPTRRSMCWPTAGWCTRRWPAGSGRAAATTSRAAPSASATSCRT